MHTMTLYSDPCSAQSHRVRIVLGEKDLTFNVVNVYDGEKNEDLMTLNPNYLTPTFVDRNLVLYEPKIIMEYLDERFPHPPLMPVDPVVRAKTRMVLHYIEKDLYGLLDDIKLNNEKKSNFAKKKLKENLMFSIDFIQGNKYFLSNDFSIVDCSMAPILWRLPEYGIDLLEKESSILLKYAARVFQRNSFFENLSEQEEEIRNNYFK